jgi:signal transduction histidine kinase
MANGKISRGNIRIQTRSSADHFEISIRDNEMGISKTNLNRVFDPFFTTKDVGKGTGQGLALAHNIIMNQHKGFIDVDLKPGEGTCFTIYLPVGNGIEPGETA